MFTRVRRFSRAVVYSMVAVQLLLAVPAMAASQAGAASAHEIPCDEMPMPAGDDHCPCCPDGADSMTDCLAACTLAATAAASIPASQVFFVDAPACVESFHAFESLSEPPLNPPPIA